MFLKCWSRPVVWLCIVGEGTCEGERLRVFERIQLFWPVDFDQRDKFRRKGYLKVFEII